MTITYIFHSGFVLETEKSILIFDYWLDPSAAVPSFLKKGKPVYVFSSHFHEDHFNREIFEWRKQHNGITYILSKDIYKHRRANKDDADVWLAKGGTWSDGTISVWALGSTDSGVSWIVETEGKRIFHAGDLNNWYARFLPCKRSKNDYLSEAVPGQTIYSEEFDEEIDPIAHEKQYLGELKDIRKISDCFDLVMFPIDGRIGNGYTLGGRQFIERFKVGLFVPMHFVASGFESAWRMKEFTDEKDIPFWEISREGETITIG
ncbi:MAG: MBL fold metallo-hydrolase [Prevotella sp.]|nr:MBL fold metallo-hydrolase [Prevotella sp.]